ncbi:MAG: DUF1307 domain-containing protein [Anaerorhabdus sp.]
MKKLILGFLALALITGCTSKPVEPTPESSVLPESTSTPSTDAKEESKVPGSILECTLDSDGDKIISTIYHSDDKVTKVVREIHYSSKNHELEDLKEQVESNKQVYENQTGLEYEVSSTDEYVIAKFTVDVTTASEETKFDVGLDDDVKTGDHYDVNKIKSISESQGASCQVK